MANVVSGLPNDVADATSNKESTQPVANSQTQKTEVIQPTDTTLKPGKLKKFHFHEAYDVMMLKAVRASNAHVAKWGEMETLYGESLKMFLDSLPSAAFMHHRQPSSKTLTDRFKRIVATRREQVKTAEAGLGILEKYGEREKLLDVLIHEMDEKDKLERTQHKQQTGAEKMFVDTGEAVRRMPLNRQSKKRERADTTVVFDDVEVKKDDTATSSSRCKRKCLKKESQEGISEARPIDLKQIRDFETAMEELERERFELEKKRFEFEKERERNQHTQFLRRQETENRRLELDAKRLELVIEDRRANNAILAKLLEMMGELMRQKNSRDGKQDKLLHSETI